MTQDQIIVYPGDDNRAMIVIPAPQALSKYSIHDIAQRSVPPGRPWRIMDRRDLPTDRTFRDAWEYSDD